MFTADPRVHVFEDKLYIYPSHDIEANIPEDDDGSHFDMKDCHVFSMDEVGGSITDHGVALHLDDIPWADRQLWSNDAANKNGRYYMYFPAKDKEGIFRIGVAISDRPYGPFKAEQMPIAGSYSIDPSVFQDEDGKYYIYWGGLWGGQLQRWQFGKYKPDALPEPNDNKPAIGPRVALLSNDMLSFAESPKELRILDASKKPIIGTDHDRRFFEACWMHKYNGRYYLSYSTGNTHKIVYATGDNPYGPFTFQGTVLTPVLGWTTHHSIVKFKDKWYLFYHDCELSKGKTHLRSIKVTELNYRPDGSIVMIDGSI